MRIKIVFTILAIGLSLIDTHAQNFAGDSIYYTPIPVPTSKQVTHKRVFLDTDNTGPLIKYYFTIQVGQLINCHDCGNGGEVTFTTSTIHGIAIGKKLSVGAGVGLDLYNSWHTMPIFGSISWDVIGTRNTNAVFIQFNYGWSEAWLSKDLQEYGYKGTSGGRMSAIHMGYRVKYHDLRIALSVGVKFQRVNAYYEYPSYYYRPDGSAIEGTPSSKSIQEDMTRMMILMIIGWK